MNRTYLYSKIHRAKITDAKLEYEGSLTLDLDLIEAAKLEIHEKVLVVNITNGQRFETYLIEGERGSGTVCANGAAARLVQPGDDVIIMSFVSLNEQEAKVHKPQIIKVNKDNQALS